MFSFIDVHVFLLFVFLLIEAALFLVSVAINITYMFQSTNKIYIYWYLFCFFLFVSILHNVWQFHELRFVVFSFFLSLSLSVMYNTSHISVASLVSAEVNNVYSVTHEWRGNISTEYLWFFKPFDRFFVRLKDKLLWKRDRMNIMKDWRGVFFILIYMWRNSWTFL